MTADEPSDELDRRLRAARPHTYADDGWAASAAGDALVDKITATPVVMASPRRRRTDLGVGLVAAACAAALLVGSALADPDTRESGGDGPPGASGGAFRAGGPAAMSLVSYDTCSGLLDGLRHTALTHMDAYRYSSVLFPVNGTRARDLALPAATAKAAATPDHSGTNNQEADADEPDVVKNDGRRMVSLTDGQLTVVNIASRSVTGHLDLSMYDGSRGATMLLSGDRVLVALNSMPVDYGIRRTDAIGGTAPRSRSTYLLVDLARSTPRVISTFRPTGDFVDARLVDGRVRLVVRSSTSLRVPEGTPRHQRSDAWRRQVERAPLSTWTPTYTVDSGGRTTTGTVPCDSIAHPKRYTGASMLTVYTIDPDTGFDRLRPVTVAADGSTVYGSGRSLYVTGNQLRNTQVHRFDIAGAKRPVYVGTGTVPGYVQSSYSLSEYDNALRIVTTEPGKAATSVYALDTTTMQQRGHVSGLGRNERVYGVRFAGPLGYVVTFRQVDPLYVLDLSDPDHPRRSGDLKITGYSAYLHDVGAGRLLGIGAAATGEGERTGTQVSLFDVSNPVRPSQLWRVVRRDTEASVEGDTHGFLYWPATKTAFIPITRYTDTGLDTGVLVLDVNVRSVTVRGRIGVDRPDPRDGSVSRTVVVGDTVWTLSVTGWQVSSLDTLHREATVRFP